MKTGRPKSKVIKKQFAAFLEPDLYAELKIALAKNKTSFTSELTKWVKSYLNKQSPAEVIPSTPPPVDISVPDFIGKKPEQKDWF